MKRTPKTVVVGAGIAGCAVALALRDHEASVTLLERGRPGGGATGTSGGMLAPQYEADGPAPLFQLALRSRGAWPGFARRVENLSGRSVRLRGDGMLVAAEGAEDEKALRRAARWQAERGLDAEMIPGEEAGRLEPAVGRAVTWLWLPREAQVDAQALGPALGEAVRASGAELRTGRGVTRLLTGEKGVEGLELEDGSVVRAERIVLAAGAWTAGIGSLPRSLPVRPVRGQLIRFGPKPAPPGPASPPGPSGPPAPARSPALPLRRLVANPRGRYVIPRDDGSVVAGSTMEEAGFSTAVTDEGVASIRESAIRLVPSLEGAEVAETWAGLRPVTADGLPVLGADPAVEGLFWATGYGRNGILLAPRAADLLVARLLEGAGAPEAEEELAPFRPDRFTRRPGLHTSPPARPPPGR